MFYINIYLASINFRLIYVYPPVVLLQAQPGSWLVPPGQCHLSTPDDLAVELVREKLLRRLHKELPYKLVVRSLGVRFVPPRGKHGRLMKDVDQRQQQQQGQQQQDYWNWQLQQQQQGQWQQQEQEQQSGEWHQQQQQARPQQQHQGIRHQADDWQRQQQQQQQQPGEQQQSQQLDQQQQQQERQQQGERQHNDNWQEQQQQVLQEGRHHPSGEQQEKQQQQQQLTLEEQHGQQQQQLAGDLLSNGLTNGAAGAEQGARRGLLHIGVEVLTGKPRVRSIVVGPKGSIIQDYVVQPTQEELSALFGHEVRLHVSVKV